MSYTPLPNPWKGIPYVGALIDAIQNYLAGLSGGGGATVAVTQTAHGFVVGNVLRYDSTSHTYVKAKADTAADAEVVGIVSAVADANDFTLLQLGKITGLTGLTEGSVYFLDPSTAGALTTTEPSTAGQISKPLLVATSTTVGYFFNWRGEVLTAAAAPSGVTHSVTQTAHGFVVGDVLYLNGTTYTKAKADSATTSDVVGVVSTVTDANDFVLTSSGYINGLSGLTAGTTYFLSDATAGLLTATEPTTVGHVSKPLFVADSTTSGYLFVMRGFVIPTPYVDSDIAMIVALG